MLPKETAKHSGSIVSLFFLAYVPSNTPYLVSCAVVYPKDALGSVTAQEYLFSLEINGFTPDVAAKEFMN
jgi:hypothetical protein